MPVVVGRPFEAASNVVARAVTRHDHRLRCCETPDTRTANEIEVSVLISPQRIKRQGQLVSKRRIALVIGKAHPFDHKGLLPYGR